MGWYVRLICENISRLACSHQIAISNAKPRQGA